MVFYAVLLELRVWIREALRANAAYFRERRRLWTSLNSIAGPEEDANLREARIRAEKNLVDQIPIIKIDLDDWFAIKTFCTSRTAKGNAVISDDNRMAFDVVLGRLDARCS